MTKSHHPDSHELNDWAMYGPKNPEIAWLVDRLALDLPLNFHPAATGARLLFTPIGAD